jgi:hypothetical protein
VQSTVDRKFYFRNGDEFAEMPYDMLRRMFSATTSPDLTPIFDARIVTLNDDQSWSVPILLSNQSSAAARDVRVSVTVANPEATVAITSDTFRDVSHLNPGQRMFMTDFPRASLPWDEYGRRNFSHNNAARRACEEASRSHDRRICERDARACMGNAD